MKNNAPGCRCNAGYAWASYRDSSYYRLCARGTAVNTYSVPIPISTLGGHAVVGLDIERKRLLYQTTSGQIRSYSLDGTQEVLWDVGTEIAGKYPLMIKYYHTWGVAAVSYIESDDTDIPIATSIGLPTNAKVASFNTDGDIMNGPYNFFSSSNLQCTWICSNSGGDIFWYGAGAAGPPAKQHVLENNSITCEIEVVEDTSENGVSVRGDLLHTSDGLYVPCNIYPYQHIGSAGFRFQLRQGLYSASTGVIDENSTPVFTLEEINPLVPSGTKAITDSGPAGRAMDWMVYDPGTSTFDSKMLYSSRTSTAITPWFAGLSRLTTSLSTNIARTTVVSSYCVVK